MNLNDEGAARLRPHACSPLFVHARSQHLVLAQLMPSLLWMPSQARA
jgi:hypothetical protein